MGATYSSNHISPVEKLLRLFYVVCKHNCAFKDLGGSLSS